MPNLTAMPRGAYRRQPRRLPRSWGFSRYALGFDGSDDRVEVPDDPSLDITDGLTLEAMLYHKGANSGDVWQGIITKGAETGNGYNIAIRTSADNFNFILQIDNTNYNFSTKLADYPLQWVHMVVTIADTTGSIYINNVLDDSLAAATPSASTQDLWVGDFVAAPGNPFYGLILFVRVYAGALTQQQRAWNMLNYHNPVRSGLRLWLPFEEGAGTTAEDYSDNANNGSLVNGPTWERVDMWAPRAMAGC